MRAVARAGGRLVAGLKEGGRFDNTFFVITADHGGELGERGWIGHTRNLRSTVLDVPLVLSSLSWGRFPRYLPDRETSGQGIYQEEVALLEAGSLEHVIEAVGNGIQDLL